MDTLKKPRKNRIPGRALRNSRFGMVLTYSELRTLNSMARSKRMTKSEYVLSLIKADRERRKANES